MAIFVFKKSKISSILCKFSAISGLCSEIRKFCNHVIEAIYKISKTFNSRPKIKSFWKKTVLIKTILK